MSAKSIALFEAHRARTTVPAAPANDPAAEWDARARKYHLRASRALAKALEAQAMAEMLRGTPRNDSEAAQ